MKSHSWTFVFGICLFSVFCLSTAKGDFPELLRQIPYTANKVTLINATDLKANASDALKQEVGQMLDASEAWPILAPWNPTRIVTAAEVDIQHMEPSWQMVAVEFEQTPDLEQVAKSANGVVDKLDGQGVVWLENAGVMVTGERQLTIVSPLNRQSAARWLRRVQNQRAADLSPFLKDSVKSAMDGGGEIVELIDLSNVFEPNSVRSVVAASPLLNKIDPDPTNLLCSVRGVSIVCNVDDNAKSTIRVDFLSSTQPLAPIAKEFLMGALTRTGAMLNEFDNWQFSAVEKSVSMTGTLTPQGVGRILSLASLTPVQAQHDVADATTKNDTSSARRDSAAGKSDDKQTTSTDNSVMARATRNYYRRIKSALQDVTRNQNPNQLDRSALWVNNKVKNIESMTTRNVDPEMVAYAQKITEGLRNIVYQYHHAEIRTEEKLAPVGRMGRTRITAVPWRSTNYGGHRMYDYAPMVSQDLYLGGGPMEKQAIRDREGFDAGQSAIKIMQQINEETAAIEQRMVEKYGESFKL